MNYIYFIQSVTKCEWEVGEIMHNEIQNNPKFCNCISQIFYAKTSSDFVCKLNEIVSCKNDDDFIVIQLVAHSNQTIITFKNVECENPDEIGDEISWIFFNEIFDKLYNKFKSQVLLILITCESANYFATLTSPHIHVIAAEGNINSHRAEKQLFTFYNELNKGNDFEQSYLSMIEKYPIAEERKRTGKDMAILKYYK